MITQTNHMHLMTRANTLFPITDYTSEDDVRSARRKYLEAVEYLRTSGDASKWLLDHKVNRLDS